MLISLQSSLSDSLKILENYQEMLLCSQNTNILQYFIYFLNSLNITGNTSFYMLFQLSCAI